MTNLMVGNMVEENKQLITKGREEISINDKGYENLQKKINYFSDWITKNNNNSMHKLHGSNFAIPIYQGP